jgi:ribosomal protein L37AE/L43A
MNPLWTMTTFMVMKAARVCPHCRKRAVYPRKRSGQFHTCKFCKRKFKEKG